MLASISASSTCPKRFQTQHSLFRDFRADKTFTTGWSQCAEFKFESKFEPLQIILQSLLKAIPEDNLRFWLQNQWQSSLGRALAHQMDKLKQGVSPSWLQLLVASTGLLVGKMLSLLLYWLASRGKKALMPCKFCAVSSLITIVWICENEIQLQGVKTLCCPLPNLWWTDTLFWYGVALYFSTSANLASGNPALTEI